MGCGPAGWGLLLCLLIRAASRIEQINLNADVPDPWQDIADRYQLAFRNGLPLATQQPAARVPDKPWLRVSGMAHENT